MENLFWFSLSIMIYTFLGYGVIISILAKFKTQSPLPELADEDLPNVTLLVAAYNEADIIETKVMNCLDLDYPKDKLKIFFVTDGSDDGTPTLIQNQPEVRVFHREKRQGKIAAVNRVMPMVDTEITVFTDANVMINTMGLRKMARHFQRNKTGAVSGEKVVLSKAVDAASASGEGFYWKYESYLKRKDSEWNTMVGAAGELFAIRTHLFETVETHTLIEDFMMTMGIAEKGYNVVYEPKAIATETASANIEEVSKRKVRIAAGGLQSVIKLAHLLNPVHDPKLTFQYVSHRVLRWTLMPLAMIVALLSNALLVNEHLLYLVLFAGQIFFYSLALAGHYLQNKAIQLKGFFAPYYFVFMHICVVKGWFRYFSGQQKVTWEKAKRVAMEA